MSLTTIRSFQIHWQRDMISWAWLSSCLRALLASPCSFSSTAVQYFRTASTHPLFWPICSFDLSNEKCAEWLFALGGVSILQDCRQIVTGVDKHQHNPFTNYFLYSSPPPHSLSLSSAYTAGSRSLEWKMIHSWDSSVIKGHIQAMAYERMGSKVAKRPLFTGKACLQKGKKQLLLWSFITLKVSLSPLLSWGGTH